MSITNLESYNSAGGTGTELINELPIHWSDGEEITKYKLDHIENGIVNVTEATQELQTIVSDIPTQISTGINIKYWSDEPETITAHGLTISQNGPVITLNGMADVSQLYVKISDGLEVTTDSNVRNNWEKTVKNYYGYQYNLHSTISGKGTFNWPKIDNPPSTPYMIPDDYLSCNARGENFSQGIEYLCDPDNQTISVRMQGPISTLRQSDNACIDLIIPGKYINFTNFTMEIQYNSMIETVITTGDQTLSQYDKKKVLNNLDALSKEEFNTLLTQKTINNTTINWTSNRFNYKTGANVTDNTWVRSSALKITDLYKGAVRMSVQPQSNEAKVEAIWFSSTPNYNTTTSNPNAAIFLNGTTGTVGQTITFIVQPEQYVVIQSSLATQPIITIDVVEGINNLTSQVQTLTQADANLLALMAQEWSADNWYQYNSIVRREGKIYIRITSTVGHGNWVADDWLEVTLAQALHDESDYLFNRSAQLTTQTRAMLAPAYDPEQTFTTGTLATNPSDGKLYRATTNVSEEDFTSDHWENVTVEQLLSDRPDRNEAQEMLDSLHQSMLTPLNRLVFPACKRNITINTGTNQRSADIVYNHLVSHGNDLNGSTFRTVCLTTADPVGRGKLTSYSNYPVAYFQEFGVDTVATHKLVLRLSLTMNGDGISTYSLTNTPVCYIATYNPETGQVEQSSFEMSNFGYLDTAFGLSRCLQYGNICIIMLFKRPTQTVDAVFNLQLVNTEQLPHLANIPELQFTSTGKYLDSVVIEEPIDSGPVETETSDENP